MNKKDFHDFVVAVYKAATPSVDFDRAERINSTDHRLNENVYNRILKNFAGDDENIMFACNMWTMNYGPTIVMGC